MLDCIHHVCDSTVQDYIKKAEEALKGMSKKEEVAGVAGVAVAGVIAYEVCFPVDGCLLVRGCLRFMQLKAGHMLHKKGRN